MNEPRSPFDPPFGSPLDRLLEEAAMSHTPKADVARLETMLTAHHRHRGLVLFTGAAASLLLIGGGALAMRADSPGRVQPAHSEPHDSEPWTTAPHDTEPRDSRPDGTEPAPEPHDTEPDGTEPAHTEPPQTEPSRTEPPRTEPPRTEPPRTDPPRTEPPHTSPPATEPPATEPPNTEPPTTEPVGWSAHQSQGESDHVPPTSVYYGTAQPGATVIVSSPYGGGQTVANERGQWELRVYFPESPLGVPFQVWVSSGEHLDDFWFTHVG